MEEDNFVDVFFGGLDLLSRCFPDTAIKLTLGQYAIIREKFKPFEDVFCQMLQNMIVSRHDAPDFKEMHDMCVELKIEKEAKAKVENEHKIAGIIKLPL